MSVIALNDYANPMSDTINHVIPWGLLRGTKTDEIINLNEDKKQKIFRKKKQKIDLSERILEQAVAQDIVVTSTLTNISMDFINAIQIISNLDDHGIRVIAYAENYDSASANGQALIQALPIMIQYRRNVFESRRDNRMAGIERAAAEGKYKGRQAYDVDDFPEFRNLYENYMYREIGKGEFAEKLGISRPTLDRLLDEFTRKG